MTYGWVLFTDTKQKLAEGHGPYAGPPSSTRAEAGGMHSARLFLAELQLVSHHAMGNPNIKLMADNSSLISQETHHLEYDELYPNFTLKVESDLTEQIYQTLMEAGIQATYHYIQGYHDDHRPYSSLSFEAQLNVQADQLAGEFLWPA